MKIDDTRKYGTDTRNDSTKRQVLVKRKTRLITEFLRIGKEKEVELVKSALANYQLDLPPSLSCPLIVEAVNYGSCPKRNLPIDPVPFFIKICVCGQQVKFACGTI